MAAAAIDLLVALTSQQPAAPAVELAFSIIERGSIATLPGALTSMS